MADLDLASGEDLNAFEARLRDLYSKGRISAGKYFSSRARERARLYLSKESPRAQSGHGALRRLPASHARLFLGNAVYWKPPLTFDYVYTMILPDFHRELRKEFDKQGRRSP